MWHTESHLETIGFGKIPCYDPAKDILIPAMFSPHKYLHSPLFGAPDQERDIFALFKGDLRTRDTARGWMYSRGIRQRLANLTTSRDWWNKHRIWIGNELPPDIPERSYSELLAHSVFCFVIMGDGWSSRFEDSIVHGCIPVVIMDDVDPVFGGGILDVDEFSIRISQKDMGNVPDILKAVQPEDVFRMQQNVKAVWHR